MKVGDYVRTKLKVFQPSQIARIKSMQRDVGYKNQYFIDLNKNLLPNFEFEIYEEDIFKSSPNMIDLIEVGDYVNGKLVTQAEDVYTADNIYIGKEVFVNHEELIIEEDIKSIVTHEQFSQMEYRIGE